MRKADLNINDSLPQIQSKAGVSEKCSVVRIVKGRPKTSESDNKRECILDSALHLFAVQGVSDTTTAYIAKRAGVTSAMIHYYFGSFEGLLQTLVRERLSPKIQEVWEGIDEKTSVLEFVEIFVSRIFSVIEDIPLFPMLWNREIFHAGGRLRKYFVDYIPVHKFETARQIFQKAQENGEVRAAVLPEMVFFSVISLIMFPLAVSDVFAEKLHVKLPEKAVHKDYVRTLILNGILAEKGK